MIQATTTDYILIITAIAAALIYFFVMVYPKIVQDKLAAYSWYTDYCNLYEQIEQINTWAQMDMAIKTFSHFISKKENTGNKHHKKCSRVLEKNLTKKYKQIQLIAAY